MNEILLLRNLTRLSKGEQNNLINSLNLLSDEINNIQDEYPQESLDSPDVARQAILQLVDHLKKMSDLAFGEIKDLIAELFLENPDAYERVKCEEFMVENGEFSFLEYGLMYSLDDYISHAECVLSQPCDNNLSCNISLFNLGVTMSHLTLLGKKQEIQDISETCLKLIERTKKSTETATRKKSTENARKKRLIESSANRETIIKTYEALKGENPNISKDAASLQIGNIAKINLTPRVIRRYLTENKDHTTF